MNEAFRQSLEGGSTEELMTWSCETSWFISSLIRALKNNTPKYILMQEPLEHSGMWPLDECQESPLLSWCPLTDWCARQNLLIISYLCGQVQCGQAPRPIPLSYPFVCVTYRSLTPRDQFLVLCIRASGGSRCPVKYLGQDI